MKKIINGKVYNTETAECIGHYWNGCSNSDFNHISESLYLSPKCQYFIAGEGGALTGYARSCGNNSVCGGERMELLTKEEALEWCEAHLETEEYEEYFKDLIAEG